MYPKTNMSRMFGSKGDMMHKLIGGIKNAGKYADDPLVQFGVGLIQPEAGLALKGISAARHSSLLKKAMA